MSPDSTVYAIGVLVVVVLVGLLLVFFPRTHRETDDATNVPPPERDLTDVETADLVSFFEGRDEVRAQRLLAPYVGRWLSLRVRLGAIAVTEESVSVSASDLTSKPPEADESTHGGTPLLCSFESGVASGIETRMPGDLGTLTGRIKDVRNGTVLLDACELKDVDPRPEGTLSAGVDPFPVPEPVPDPLPDPVAASVPIPEPLVEIPPPMKTGETPRPLTPAPRMFVNASPAYLLELCVDRSPTEVDEATEPYLGKWLDVTLIVSQVTDYAPGNCTFVNGRASHLSDDAPEARHATQDFACTFDRKAWLPHLERRRSGDAIRVVGELANIGSDGLRLIRCEIPTVTNPSHVNDA
ncbi:MAG: hypothetical protein ABI672_11930 [Vicinamibacteria bacterium]